MNGAQIERGFAEVNTRSADAVRQEALEVFRRLFPAARTECICEAFDWAEEAFAGRYADFQAIDAKYHDFEHTLQGTLCFVRLLDGYQRAGTHPPLTPRLFELGILAILLHDTGYLKRQDDRQGTGAKYTLTHVARSAAFAHQLLKDRGFAEEEIRAVQNMIRCTGVNADLQSIPFQSVIERHLGFALGTADLLGQMAAADYVDKLDILYQEFEEANRFSGRVSGPGVYTSAEELRRKTPLFWEKYVLPRINGDFIRLYQFLTRGGENLYMRRIEDNIERLKQTLETAAP